MKCESVWDIRLNYYSLDVKSGLVIIKEPTKLFLDVDLVIQRLETQLQKLRRENYDDFELQKGFRVALEKELSFYIGLREEGKEYNKSISEDDEEFYDKL